MSRLSLQLQALLLGLLLLWLFQLLAREVKPASCLLLCAAHAVGCSVRPTGVRPAAPHSQRPGCCGQLLCGCHSCISSRWRRLAIMLAERLLRNAKP